MAKTTNIKPFDFHDTNKARGNGVKIAKNKDPGNFYRRKAKMDADNDMSAEKYDPTEGKKRGKKLLDDLLDGV
mgnify:CR=1 FL=1|tara:strand:+ start:87 stop:305 length:219 start_codon:yes stop_codon:yes gene_type:complete